MLVLSRKKGERIRIGERVELVVLAVSGSRVKLGFSGPPDVWIHREEILPQVQVGAEANGLTADR
jgi:carbon storage regulator